MSRTREERETGIIMSDAATCTVWSCSPTKIRQLTKRLGVAPRIDGETHFWEISPETHSITLPRKRGKPRNTGNRGGFQPKKPEAVVGATSTPF